MHRSNDSKITSAGGSTRPLDEPAADRDYKRSVVAAIGQLTTAENSVMQTPPQENHSSRGMEP